MFNAYKYLYYRIYLWNSNTGSEKERAHDQGVLYIAMLTSFNILSLLAILQILTGIEFLSIGALPVFYLFVIVVVYISIHYLILYGKGRYKQIIAEYGQKDEDYHQRYTTWVLAYVIGTPILLALSSFLAGIVR